MDESVEQGNTKKRRITFQNVVDVVFVVKDAHGVVQIAFLVAVAVLGDEDLGIVELVLDEVEHLPQTERCDLEPNGRRSATQQHHFHAVQVDNIRLEHSPEPGRILVRLNILIRIVADPVDVLHFVADVARRVVVEAEEIRASLQLLDLGGCEFRKTRFGEALSCTLPANLRKSIKSVNRRFKRAKSLQNSNSSTNCWIITFLVSDESSSSRLSTVKISKSPTALFNSYEF